VLLIYPIIFMKKISGFTLVELMIVIAVIAILVAVMFPTLTQYIKRSRDVTRFQDISGVAQALRIYEIDTGFMKRTQRYGGNDIGGWDYSSQPVGNPSFVKYLVDEGYLTKMPKDPLNNAVGDIAAWWSVGYSYFYYCYQVAEFPSITYEQFVLGARLESPPPWDSLRAGRMWWADGSIFYFWKWHEGIGANGVIRCY
jgi:prepilin-type N-terminal cleavage/methylation domain-containing protein